MRTLQILSLALLATTARADYYKYFYACESSTICDTFTPSGFYGDFGMNGQPPVLGPSGFLNPSDGYSVHVFASNAAGQVLASVDTGHAGDSGPATGFGGSLQMIGQLIDPIVFPSRGYISADGTWVINDFSTNGDYVAWVNGARLNGQMDSVAIAKQLGVLDFGGEGIFTGSFAEGINDQDQLLVDIPILTDDGGGRTIRGVLSPFAVNVPEPSNLLLLATVVIGLGWVRRRVAGPIVS